MGTKSKERRKRVTALIERDGPHCHYCRRQLSESDPTKERPTVDHLVPRAEGGSSNLENLVLACGLCNNLRGCTPADEFREMMTSWATA